MRAPTGAAAHTVAALNVNLELQRQSVVNWKQSVSAGSVMFVMVDSNSGTYSARHITGHQFLKTYVDQQAKQ